VAGKKRTKTPCDLGHHTFFLTIGGDELCQLCGFRQKAKTGEELKKEGMGVALDAMDITEWKEKFQEHLEGCASSKLPFTSEHVIAIVGLPRGEVRTNANNAVGAMMNAAAKRGIIKKTGRRVQSKRPSSHGAELTEWIGT